MLDAPPVPPPPPISVPAPPQSVPAIITWQAGVVRCALRTVKPVRLEAPLAVPAVLYGNADVLRSRTIALSFRIDGRGRALGIRREAGDNDPLGYMLGDTSDLEPSLTAAQFSADAPAEDCRVTFAPHIVTVAEASDEQIARVLAGPHARTISSYVRKRMTAGDNNCLSQPPQPLTLSYPNLAKREAVAGAFDQVAYRYDIDATGKPVNVVPIIPVDPRAADIDVEVRRALMASRFGPEARKGCWFVHGTPSTIPLAAPERPPMASFAIKGAKCPFPATKLLKVASVPFPESFRRRNTEGWVVVRFDLAPWGAVGNAKVLAAEPSDVFGKQALALIGRATMDPSPSGYSGCVAPIRYQITNAKAAGVTGPNNASDDDDASPLDDGE